MESRINLKQTTSITEDSKFYFQSQQSKLELELIEIVQHQDPQQIPNFSQHSKFDQGNLLWIVNSQLR